MRSVLKNVERDLRILYEIASEEKLSFKLAVISAEFQKDFLLKELSAGRIEKLGPAPEVTEEAIRESTHIVAQMGVEPIIEALDRGADVVFSVYALLRTRDPLSLFGIRYEDVKEGRK